MANGIDATFSCNIDPGTTILQRAVARIGTLPFTQSANGIILNAFFLAKIVENGNERHLWLMQKLSKKGIKDLPVLFFLF